MIELPDADPQTLAWWAEEMRLKVSEDEDYLARLRRKGDKPKEILDNMEFRLGVRRGLRDWLNRCASHQIPEQPPEPPAEQEPPVWPD